MNETVQSQNDTTNEIGPKFSTDKCVVIGIYGLRNKTNGKWYVGQSWDVMDRWRRYKRYGCRQQPKLHSALIKYGYDGFEKRIIEWCDSTIPQDALDKKEDDWIQHLNTINHGYNLRGGGSRGKLSSETKRKLSQGRIGRTFGPLREETKRRIRASNLGRIVSVETREKIRQYRLNHPMSKLSRDKQQQTMQEKYKKVLEERRINPPKFSRKCPICGTELFYSSNKLRNKANKKSQKCRSCAQKTPINEENRRRMNVIRMGKINPSTVSSQSNRHHATQIAS